MSRRKIAVPAKIFSIGSIDLFVDEDEPAGNLIPPDRSEGVAVEYGRVLRVVGWALAPDQTPFARLFLRVGSQEFPCNYGRFRTDVAQIFGTEEAGRCLFACTFPTGVLTPGLCEVRLRGEDSAGESFDSAFEIGLIVNTVRPLSSVLALPTTESLAFALDRKDESPQYAIRGHHITVSGRLLNAHAAPDIVAVANSSVIARSRIFGANRFVIDVPTESTLADSIKFDLVATDGFEKIARQFGPFQILERPPSNLLGLSSMGSTASGAARITVCRLADGRIDRRRIKVTGFVFDARTHRRGGGVAVRCVDEREAITIPPLFFGVYGLSTNQHASLSEFGAPADCGFEAEIERGNFRAGWYRIEVLMLSIDLRSYYQPIVIGSIFNDHRVALGAESWIKRNLIEEERSRSSG